MLYVDAILLGNNNETLLHETKHFQIGHFEMEDFGDVCFVLSIQIHCGHLRGILIKKVFCRYDIQNCALVDTPMTKGHKFSLQQYLKIEFEIKGMQKFLYALVQRVLCMLKYVRIQI